MMYVVYWRDENRKRYHGYVKAKNRDKAFDIANGMLSRNCNITAVYMASENAITPQSICLNFANTTDYTLF